MLEMSLYTKNGQKMSSILALKGEGFKLGRTTWSKRLDDTKHVLNEWKQRADDRFYGQTIGKMGRMA